MCQPRRSAERIAAIEAALLTGETGISVAERLAVSKFAVYEIARRLIAEGRIAPPRRGRKPRVDPDGGPQAARGYCGADDSFEAWAERKRRPMPQPPIARSDWISPIPLAQLMAGR